MVEMTFHREPISSKGFVFFVFLFLFLFFSPTKSQFIQEVVISLCILPCYEPLDMSETYGLLTYGLCLLILL